MSDPSTPSLTSSLSHHHHHSTPHPPLHIAPPPIPPLPTTAPPSPSPSSPLSREYRKGNWTVHETLILITAKRLNDERRSIAHDTKPLLSPSPFASTTATTTPTRSAELRWKWVENYCWRNGCLRSQNQCNDKWDNLLRDYKKVRDYESRSTSDGSLSYWNMEKHERKDRNLPSNLASEVFHALTDVLSRRNTHKVQLLPALPPPPPPAASHPTSDPPLLLPPPPEAPANPLPPPPSGAETSGKNESDEGKEKIESNGKRRKKSRDLGSSVTRGASVLSRTLLACEEMREKRHRDLVELETRRLRMEEDRTEMSRQGIAGLIAAVNGLSGAIHALVSDRQHHNRRRSDEC